MGYRFDNFYSRLGKHNEYGRIWVEDTFDRLTRNNFGPGTAFSVTHRGGAGYIFSAEVLGGLSVSRRGKLPLFSYESRALAHHLNCSELRMKVSVGRIVVVPLVRAATVSAANRTQIWTIRGANLLTEAGPVLLDAPRPLALPAGEVLRIEAHLDETNLVAATEYIGRARVPEVALFGADFLCGIARQFFADCGYSADATGLLRR